MKQRPIFIALAATVLLLCAGLSFAIVSKAEASQANDGTKPAAPKTAQKDLDAKRKAAPQIKLVDINSATKEELKKLPGIGDAEADKIIAGRPYGSKAWLVTNNILSSEVFDTLRNRVIAKQPYTDGAKNAALYAPKK